MTLRSKFILASVLALVMSLGFEQHMMADSERFFGVVEFDRTIVDFGDVSLDDGPLTCQYKVKNISRKPIAIYNISTTCGCTEVKWTREPIQPGQSGTISVTYSNDEGPYPFDKNLSVYISGVKSKIQLKLRGVVHSKKLPLDQIYTIRMGALGLKDVEFKCGNLQQGGSKSDFANIANLSDKPIRVSFTNVSKGLSISTEPQTIGPGKVAKMHFTVTADREIWGKNWYYATPVVNGIPQKQLAIWAFTKESFPAMTTAEKSKAPRPMFDSSTYSFGKIKRGTHVKAEYQFNNAGKQDFKVYKVDIDVAGTKASAIPTVKPGGKCTFTVDLDTSTLPLGETTIIVTLTTNSPLRPIVNLFVVGWLI